MEHDRKENRDVVRTINPVDGYHENQHGSSSAESVSGSETDTISSATSEVDWHSSACVWVGKNAPDDLELDLPDMRITLKGNLKMKTFDASSSVC